jgi:hypothetical protein
MSYYFYKTAEYKNKQSILTRKNWQNGIFDNLFKKQIRLCKRKECKNKFEVILSDPKQYCSKSCSATENNLKRGKHSELVKLKISNSLKDKPNKYKGIKKIPLLEIHCVKCDKIFYRERWMKRKFCSVKCAMAVIGGKPTSPKASRGISGIRDDISKEIYFYSRWEANFARILNFSNIDWIYQARTFDLKGHTYTPDFYLPDYDVWIEIKNFLSEYSKNRDEKFRELYPKLKLILILKEDYLKLQKKFALKIKKWEYS